MPHRPHIHRWYCTAGWQCRRAHQLMIEPLCRLCLEEAMGKDEGRKMFEQPARPQVIALVVFSGDMPEVDADRAAFELERAGYRVTRLPDKMVARLAHPLDDYLEAVIEVDGPADDDARGPRD
jgi:hypothetical protein